MNDRERNLSILIVAVLVLGIGYYAYSVWSSALENAQSKLSKSKLQLEQRKRKLAELNRAKAAIEDAKARSLPDRQDIARSLYQTWLIESAQKCGIKDMNVNAVSSRQIRGFLHWHTFQLNGRADLAQASELLAQIQSRDWTHRVQRINLKPIARSRDLAISLNIEAVSTPGAKESERLPPEELTEETKEQIRTARESLLSRNFFSPENHTPELTFAPSLEVRRNESVSFDPKAVDRDPFDQLHFELVGDTRDAKIDAATGRLTWKSNATGEFPFKIKATDNGTPPLSAEKTLVVKVVEPPPGKAPFDSAKHSFLTAILETEGQRQIWIHVRTSGRTLKLKVGDNFNVGALSAKVESIEDDFAMMRQGAKRFRVARGDNLATAALKLEEVAAN